MNIKEIKNIGIEMVRKLFANKNALKKIKVILYIVVLAWVGVGVQIIVNYAFRDETKMLNAFAGADAKVVQSKLTMVGNFGEKYMTKDDKENMIDYITGKLNIVDTLEKEEVQGTSTTSMVAKKEGKNANAEIELISINSKEQESAKKTTQYIYVTVELYDDISEVLEYKNLIDQAYGELELEDIDASITLEGQYENTVSLEKRNEIADQLLTELQAKTVKENRTDSSDSVYTIYAYTPLVDDYITVEGDRVNLNIVFSYNEEEDITTLYLATPILNTDY